MSHQNMKLNVIVWTGVAILAGILLSISINFFRKKKNPSRNNVGRNGNHTALIATAATTSIHLPLSQNYEVFLNFRGEDTRKTFTDHLYHKLVDARVHVFRDDEELHIGEEIHPNIFAAIQTSKISIPIISPSYASSKWCLHELVHILKCKETMGQIVIPIFYHVNPSDVRNQTNSFGTTFCKQKKYHRIEVVQEWKEALNKVASLKALELNNNADGYEGKLVKQVVEKVLINLKKTTLIVPKYLVGVEEHAKKIMEMVDLQSSIDVQVVLIYGMGGIGKTTLAKLLYNQLANYFHFCGFLENVHERSMMQLQKQLISNILKQDWPQDIYHANEGISIIEGILKGTKVLLVLDDVDHKDQFNALVGRYDWLGLGSILIITTRNRNVLNPWHVRLAYELKELDFDQSFQLLCKHALQSGDSHFGEFETIARDVISITGGLPLAIEVIGCLLLGKGLEFWKETLKKLKRIPNESVRLKLNISYEALTHEQKQIFLDMSCLFPLIKEFAYFVYMWDDCKYYPQSEIEVLQSLCLIKVGYGNQLTMHDQLRLLGREIVKQESNYQLGRCKILWNEMEALEVMETNQGTEQIEVLNLASHKRSGENCFTSQQFERLTKLRLLQMKDANLVGDFKNRFWNLRWLQWYGCPSNFMATSFRPKNLVVLNLSYSTITEQWGGWSEMKYAEKLKVLELRWCHQLKVTPDFSTFKELEILDLSYCKSLGKIHPSIGRLTKTLKTLKMGGCEELRDLPKEMGKMEELRELCLNRTLIREIPMVEGFMTKLETLSARDCRKLARLPDSIELLKKLRHFIVDGCISLTIIPESIGKLESLYELDLSYTNIKELPESVRNLKKLERFRISGTPMKRLPAVIGMLKELQVFDAEAVHGLTEIPNEIGELTSLEDLTFSGYSMESIPNLSCLTNLNFLSLHCIATSVIQEHPSSLRTLFLRGCQRLHTLQQFSYMKHLSILVLEDCAELIKVNALVEVQSLRELTIRDCRKISKLCCAGNSLNKLSLNSCHGLKSLPDLSTFKNLIEFGLIECNEVVEIQGLDSIECLTLLVIHDCSSLERIGNLSRLTTLYELGFGNCPKLRDFDYSCVVKLTSLNVLTLYGGFTTPLFPELPKLRNLNTLGIHHFEEFKEIPNLQELKSLQCLYISGCKSLENLPDFSEFTYLFWLVVEDCEKLSGIQGLGNLTFLSRLNICGCQSLRQLPNLPEHCIISRERCFIRK